MTEALRNRVGLPRPLTRGRVTLQDGSRSKTRLPIPWSSEYSGKTNQGLATVDELERKAERCGNFEACLVCGEDLPKRFWAFYVVSTNSNQPGMKVGEWHVFEGGLHPRCAKLTAKFCPFLRESMLKGEARILSLRKSDVDKSKAESYTRTWPLKVDPAHKRDMYTLKEKVA